MYRGIPGRYPGEYDGHSYSTLLFRITDRISEKAFRIITSSQRSSESCIEKYVSAAQSGEGMSIDALKMHEMAITPKWPTGTHTHTHTHTVAYTSANSPCYTFGAHHSWSFELRGVKWREVRLESKKLIQIFQLAVFAINFYVSTQIWKNSWKNRKWADWT